MSARVPPTAEPTPLDPAARAPTGPGATAGESPQPPLATYDFALPPELIAQRPAPERSASRLLHVRPGPPGAPPSLADHVFAELPGLLAAGDLLVMNDTRVIRARLLGTKATGGRVEAMIERIDGPDEAVAMLRASHPPGPGAALRFADATATVLSRTGAFWRLRFDRPVADLLERAGRLPLPPYIAHEADAADAERYQTVYARHPGAVAAPTAGLHFDAPLLQRLAAAGIERAFVTLHVGAGTFAPVRDDDPARHEMHAERYHVPPETVRAVARARAAGGRVVAVGTTSLRTLESAADDAGGLAAGWGETRLFVRPGHRFRVVDRLITNFHLPRTTLMMLVAAFSGLDTIRAAYAHAVAQRYRFFSYGDAMLLERAP